MQWLLDNGLSINSIDSEYGLNILHVYSGKFYLYGIPDAYPDSDLTNNGKMNIINYLLLKGIDINGKDFSGKSALATSVTDCMFQMASFLIKKGALIDYGDFEGNSPLHFAVVCDRHQKFIPTLNFDKININIMNNGGCTPLHFGLFYLAEEESIKILLDNKANISTRDVWNETPFATLALMYINEDLDQDSYQELLNKKIRLIEIMMKYGANPHDIVGLNQPTDLVHRVTHSVQNKLGEEVDQTTREYFKRFL